MSVFEYRPMKFHVAPQIRCLDEYLIHINIIECRVMVVVVVVVAVRVVLGWGGCGGCGGRVVMAVVVIECKSTYVYSQFKLSASSYKYKYNYAIYTPYTIIYVKSQYTLHSTIFTLRNVV